MRAAAFVLVLAGMLVWGCGGAERAEEAGGSAGEGFPVRMTDAAGEEVVIERRPERIVSAAPVVTEILFALGAGERVVAVSGQCNYPPEVEGGPRIGGYWTPSAEKTLAARPDVVIGSRGNPTDFLAVLRKSGCPVFTVDPKTLEGIFAAVERVAVIVGESGSGDDLIGDMKERLSAVAERVAETPENERPSAFIVLQVGPVWTAGRGTFQDDAIRAAGGRNVAGGKEGFVPFSTESLLAEDPDYLLLSTMEGDPERMKREVLADPGLRRLSAVREGRMVLLDGDEIMRPGPRIVEAVEAMGEAFYGERPASAHD